MRPLALLLLCASASGLSRPLSPLRSPPSRISRPRLLAAPHEATGDGGVSSLRWVSLSPSSSRPSAATESSAPSEGAAVMPLFPLGAAYLPHTTPVLNIFEPRYRAMYNDILFNGARRFMVTNVDPESGALAEVGVVFYLDELKEVSEQTQDRVKYIGQHRVIDRVRLKKVLNPEVISTGETYLKAEVEVLHDSDMPGKIEDTEADKSEAGERSEPSGDDEDARADQPTESDEVLALQKEAEDLFIALVDMQKQLNEEPRFTDAVKGSLSFTRGTGPDDRGLWGVIGLWKQFLEQRAAVLANKMQREVQSGVAAFLKDYPKRDEIVNARGEIRLEDLPPELIAEIEGIQGRFREELDALDGEPGSLRFQALLQSDSHSERLRLFSGWLRKEQARLTARATLQKMFAKDEPGF